MSDVHTIHRSTASPEETEALGSRLGALLLPPALLLLRGELGAGKTCFVRGLAQGLGVAADEPVTSPTYALMNHYQGRCDLLHYDLYRLHGVADLAEIGFEESLDGERVVVVEWSERAEGLDLDGLVITLSVVDEETRCIVFTAMTEKYRLLLDQIALVGQN